MSPQLSLRQREVARELLAGKTYKQAALNLGLKHSTVRTHVHAIHVATGAQSTFQLILALQKLDQEGDLEGCYEGGRTEISDEQTASLYRDYQAGATIAEAAASVGLNPSTLQGRFARRGLPRRSRSDAGRLREERRLAEPLSPAWKAYLATFDELLAHRDEQVVPVEQIEAMHRARDGEAVATPDRSAPRSGQRGHPLALEMPRELLWNCEHYAGIALPPREAMVVVNDAPSRAARTVTPAQPAARRPGAYGAPMERSWLTSTGAARLLGVSLATVRRWENEGLLPCWRTPGGQRRFDRVKLEEWVRAREGVRR